MFKPKDTHLIQSMNDQTRRNGCKCKYRVRWFYSKGAFLVLVWILIINFVWNSIIRLLKYFIRDLSDSVKEPWFYIATFVLVVMTAPLSGWLADSRFGNYKIARAGFVLLFIGCFLICLFVLLLENLSVENHFAFSLRTLSFVFACFLFAVAYSMCIVTLFQLGLDQMPDASEANITSFIAWFVFCYRFSEWLNNICNYTYDYCVEDVFKSGFVQVWSFSIVLCMSIVLCTDFLLSSKWLTIEPKSPQSLKTIFKVLKFAAKHKAPVQRSAFTYWEEDIPSRIDLGKSKYGGPFTTEQVEDVKTVLRLLAVSVAFWVISFTLGFPKEGFDVPTGIPGFTVCTTYVLFAFTYNPRWCVVIGTLIYEFVIYSFIRNRLPSILKRIGASSFLITIINLVYLILEIVGYYRSNQIVTVWISSVFYSVMAGVSLQVFLTSMFEFVCAQSPYNMRGLFSGYVLFLFVFSFESARGFHSFYQRLCTSSYCPLVARSLYVLLSLFGFVLHCILARWYKRRVRDEVYHPQRVIEDVYDRYLSIPN